jgi:hypothetical protein
MLNWQGWAANFLGWGSNGAATPVATTPTGGGGRRDRRNLWTIRGKTYLIHDEEIHDLVRAILAEEKANKPAKPSIRKLAKKVRAAVKDVPVEKPTFPDMPAFDALWADLVKAQQHAQAEQLRKIAYEMDIERDDEEVFALLQMLGKHDA